MAAINFPNPSNQSPLNQYGPESVAASLNGVTYSWSNDNIWYAQTTVANFGDIYVERTGSNMTGNLTFNTDKLTLTALDGSAAFAGNIVLGTNQITLNATSGAATFAGSITSPARNDFGRLFITGDSSASPGIIVRDATGTSTNCWSGRSSNNTETSSITAAGAATFASDVISETKLQVGGNPNGGTADGFSAGSSGGTKFSRTNSGSPVIECYTTGDSAVKAAINGNGSASFASYILSGPNPGSSTSSTTGITLDGTENRGLIAIYKSDTLNSGAQPYIQGLTSGATSEYKFKINADGSAEFASYVSGDTFFWSKNADSSTAGLYLYNYDGNASRADAAFAISPTNSSTAHTVIIDYDGKATFAGDITVGTSNVRKITVGNAGVVSLDTMDQSSLGAGGIGLSKATADNDQGNSFLAGFVGTSRKHCLFTDGSAVFAGTVTANGTVLTLASGNLDVGDRLKKADDALKALKTAAAAAGDFAALKAAIATALTNI